MSRGYQIIESALIQELDLTMDEQVRLYSAFIPILKGIEGVPSDVSFRVIPICYLGSPHPGIGLTSDGGQADTGLLGLAFSLMEAIDSVIRTTGLPAVLKMASAETLTWDDVLIREGFET